MNMVNKSKRGLLRPTVALSTALLLTCVLWMAVSAGTPLGRAGFLDFSYAGVGFTASAPTGEKPESKLWWNDGFWWGSMFNKTTLKNHIYRLNWGDQVWEDTGVVLDDRSTTKADTLFVDDPVNPKLYVASHVYSGSGNYIMGASTNRPRLYRYSYNRATQTYTLDAGFPVNIGDDRAEAMTIARDNTLGAGGRLWITYVSQDRTTPTTYRVFVNATTTANNDQNWGTPAILPTAITTATTVASDDMSAVSVTNGKVVVVWNNTFTTTTKSLLNVAYRSAGFTPSNATGTDWSMTQIPIPEGTDDHINLKSLQANSTGQIFAAIKTAAPQSGPSQPHVQMVAIDISNALTPTYAIRTFSDNLAKDTRPIIVLDEGSNAAISDDRVYLFVTGSDSGSKICYGRMAVKLPLNTMDNKFKDAAGLNVDDCGTSFIEDSLTGYKDINNATSMKGSANSTTGIVVLASENTVYSSPVTSKVYVHNVLGDPPPVVTARGPSFNAVNVLATAPVTATFSKPMSATTISGVTFKVRNAAGPVAGTVTYNPGSRTASFVPAAPLQANTVYTVELTNAIKDSSNLALGGNFRAMAPYVPPIVERWKFTSGPAGVNFALASYSVLETAPSALVTVTLNTTSTTPVSVTYNTIPGTAIAGIDYMTSTNVLGFAANQRVKTFTVPILNDALFDGNRTVNLTLSAPVNGMLGLQSTAQLIIIDNEGAPSVQFDSLAPVLESAGVVNIQATLSHTSTTPISVNYLVDGGTALGSTDYNFAAGTLNFPANTTTASFPLTVINDIKDELDETVIFKLSNPIPETIPLGIPGFTATLTILDDDLAPGVKFSSATETVGEAAGVKQVMVNLTAPSELPVSVVYATSNISATAGEDYAAASGTLTFNPGEISKPIDLSIITDNLDEEDEPFDLALLSATNATLEAPFNAAVTITDDDAEPTISFTTASLSKNENAGIVLVTVNLSTASGRRVIVDYSATDGTATESQDFDVTQGQLIFAPGETEQSFELALVDDTAAEGNETVNLILNNASGATIGTGGNATLTINDNDGAPTLSFSSATYNVNENAGFATVTVNLNVALASAVTVDYAVAAGGTATPVSDYTLAPGKLTFNPGETSKSFQVTLNNDAVLEAAETVLLQLSNATNAALGTATATLTIADDDAGGDLQVSFSSATYSVGEKGGTATVTATLSAPAVGAVTVNYATANGTATAGPGNDYTTASGTLTFNAGEIRKSFTVSILDDAKKEGNETVTITLTGPTGAVLGTTASATLTIIDNENGLYLPLIRKP